jgi:subtilisin-like proprotein convertase family protein
MSTPLFGKTFTFTQPDESTLDVRGWGDQHYAVAALAGQAIAGSWRLRVADNEGADVGKLNRWKLSLQT